MQSGVADNWCQEFPDSGPAALRSVPPERDDLSGKTNQAGASVRLKQHVDWPPTTFCTETGLNTPRAARCALYLRSGDRVRRSPGRLRMARSWMLPAAQ